MFIGWTQACDLMDARVCVYPNLDALSRHTKSANYVLMWFNEIYTEMDSMTKNTKNWNICCNYDENLRNYENTHYTKH